MSLNVKTMQFGKHEISFVEWNGQWVIPSHVMGVVLGYQKNGSKLTEQIRQRWRKFFTGKETAVFLKGTELANFKRAVTVEDEVDEKIYGDLSEYTSQMVLLTVAGVLRVLSKSSSAVADDFQTWFQSKLGEFFERTAPIQAPALPVYNPPYVNPQIAHKAYGDQMEFNQKIQIVGHTERIADKLLAAKAIETHEYREIMLGNIAVIGGPKVLKEVTHNSKEDLALTPANRTAVVAEGQTVPEGTVTVKPEIVPKGDRPFGLPENWLSANEIGKLLNPELSPGEIRKYTEQLREEYRANTGKEYLANVLARSMVQATGIESMDRYQGRHVFLFNEDRSCVAFYCEADGDQVHWRNFWNPVIVQKVLDMAVEDRRIQHAKAEEKAAKDAEKEQKKLEKQAKKGQKTIEVEAPPALPPAPENPEPIAQA